MRLRVKAFTICLALQAAGLITTATPPSKLTKVRGRIIAYRPIDRVSQVSSYSPNREIFLLMTGTHHTTKSTILKVDYAHFGLSDITEEILSKGQLLSMKLSRDQTCDESYNHFVSTAPAITVTDDKSGRQRTGKAVEFTAPFNGAGLSPNLKLRCYHLETGNFTVVPQAAQLVGNR